MYPVSPSVDCIISIPSADCLSISNLYVPYTTAVLYSYSADLGMPFM